MHWVIPVIEMLFLTQQIITIIVFIARLGSLFKNKQATNTKEIKKKKQKKNTGYKHIQTDKTRDVPTQFKDEYRLLI